MVKRIKVFPASSLRLSHSPAQAPLNWQDVSGGDPLYMPGRLCLEKLRSESSKGRRSASGRESGSSPSSLL